MVFVNVVDSAAREGHFNGLDPGGVKAGVTLGINRNDPVGEGRRLRNETFQGVVNSCCSEDLTWKGIQEILRPKVEIRAFYGL